MSASLLWDRYCLMPHNGIFLARRFDSTQCQRLIPVARSARQQSGGIITFGQGEQERRITPATVKYCLTLSHYPKAPPHTHTHIHFSASHSSPPDPWAARLLFTLHTHAACVVAASWQPLLPVCVCVVVCRPAQKRIAATTKASAYRLSKKEWLLFVF